METIGITDITVLSLRQLHLSYLLLCRRNLAPELGKINHHGCKPAMIPETSMPRSIRRLNGLGVGYLGFRA